MSNKRARACVRVYVRVCARVVWIIHLRVCGVGGRGRYTLLVVVQQLAFRAGILPIDVH